MTLGDFYYDQHNCETGRSDMAYAQSVYASLNQPARYRAAFESLFQAYKRADESWDAQYSPIGVHCQEVERLGAQARLLADQMLVEAGLKVAPNPGEPFGLASALKAAVVVLFVGAALYYAPKKR